MDRNIITEKKKLSGYLLFPKLKKIKGTLYELDWTESDKDLEKKHNDWIKLQNRGGIYLGRNPYGFDKYLEGVTFDISDEYMKEMLRNVKRGQEEWCRKRYFDTMIREMCLKPAQAHIEVAFKLLADCRTTKDKRYLGNVMLYKFWAEQTGRGLLTRNSGFDNIISIYKNKESYIHRIGNQALLKDLKPIIEELEFFEEIREMYFHEKPQSDGGYLFISENRVEN